ncbi:conserved hypothetical protein [Pseudoclavibacter sp. 8L]|nr:conserved hypothetical protein [Pseudoclavibacter sp. 8L]
MTPKEAAEALHVSTKTVQRIADQGSVGFVRLPSGHRRYVRAEIVELANAQHATTSGVAAS